MRWNSVHLFCACVQLEKTTRFHGRQQRSEVLLNPGEVHLVQNHEERLVWISCRLEQQSKCWFHPKYWVLTKWIQIPEQACWVPPIWRHRNDRTVRMRVD